MSVIYAEDMPSAERPPVNGDWVALAQPHGCNYLIAAYWGRGQPQPRAPQFFELIRLARGYVEAYSATMPTMPFYWDCDGVWIGIVDPEAVDWSPAIAFNRLPV